MDSEENQAIDLYDQDIITERECPKCGSKIVSHPDCMESCSNNECDWHRK